MTDSAVSRFRNYPTSGGSTEARLRTTRGSPTASPASGVAVDRLRSQLYIAQNALERPQAFVPTMAEPHKDRLDLAALEARVDELIRTVETLANENEALRSQQTVLAAERATLIDKTEQARSRVEAMIARLKAMEAR